MNSKLKTEMVGQCQCYQTSIPKRTLFCLLCSAQLNVVARVWLLERSDAQMRFTHVMRQLSQLLPKTAPALHASASGQCLSGDR